MIGEITVAGTLTGELASGATLIEGELSAVLGLSGEMTTAEHLLYPTYDGEYEITPTQQTQTIPINGLLAADDITVNPIPSNYGLITWDGSTLTVS